MSKDGFLKKLMSIKGVGEVRAKSAYEKFGSMNALASASVDDISKKLGIGKDLASKIRSLAIVEVRKRLVRKKPRLEFKRYLSYKIKRLGEEWRKPKGHHNKVRHQVEGKPPLVKVGYRTPKNIRGVHPSGYIERVVHNVDELRLVGEGEAIKIASTVGMKKRLKIEEEAEKLGIKVLNPTRE